MVSPIFQPSPRTAKAVKVVCIIVITLGLVIRLTMLQSALSDPDRARSPDSMGYERLSDNLWNHGVFSLSESPPLEPDMTRTPGLPALWWLLHLIGLGNPEGRLALQFTLGLLVCAVGGMLATRIGGAQFGLTVTAVLSLDPLMAVYSTMLLSEMLLTLGVLLWLLSVDWFIRRPSLTPAISVGLTWGLAALVKPIVIVLSPIAVAVCLIPKAPFARRTSRLLICLTAMAAVTAPWILRNRAATGITKLSSIQMESLYFYHGAAAEAWGTGRPISEVQAEWSQRLSEANPTFATEAERLAFQRHEAYRGIREHLGAHIVGCALGVGRIALAPVRAHLTWLIPPRWGNLPLMGLQALITLALWVGVMLAILRWRSSGQHILILSVLLITVIVLIAVATGGNANARFRVPVMPALSIVGAWGWFAILLRRSPAVTPGSA